MKVFVVAGGSTAYNNKNFHLSLIHIE